MVKPAPNKPRVHYYLGACLESSTIAEIAVRSKPEIQALPTSTQVNCPTCSMGNHMITLTEVSEEQYYGAVGRPSYEQIKGFVGQLQLIAEEMDLDWPDILDAVSSSETRELLTEHLKEVFDA